MWFSRSFFVTPVTENILSPGSVNALGVRKPMDTHQHGISRKVAQLLSPHL